MCGNEEKIRSLLLSPGLAVVLAALIVLCRFSTRAADIYAEKAEAELKAFYEKVPGRYGLCKPERWQHSKPMLVHRIQSAVGVTGYTEPLGGEFHINEDVLPVNYPFTFAHDLFLKANRVGSDDDLP